MPIVNADFSNIVTNHLGCSFLTTWSIVTFPDAIAFGKETHSYMTDEPLPTLWNAFKMIQDGLYPGTNTDPPKPKP